MTKEEAIENGKQLENHPSVAPRLREYIRYLNKQLILKS